MIKERRLKMISVQVFWKSSGKPAKGSRVRVSFDGLLRGMTEEQYTDSNGEAHFNSDPGTGTVYVDGKNKQHGRLSGRMVIYI
jgi:hypothetical protein